MNHMYIAICMSASTWQGYGKRTEAEAVAVQYRVTMTTLADV